MSKRFWWKNIGEKHHILRLTIEGWAGIEEGCLVTYYGKEIGFVNKIWYKNDKAMADIMVTKELPRIISPMHFSFGYSTE